MIASGDDVNIYCRNDLTDSIKESILKHSTRTTEATRIDEDTGFEVPNRAGCGQCIKSVYVGYHFWDTEFCSKVSYAPDGTLGSWKMIRNPAKALYDKQYVTDKNIDIWMNPYLHKVGTYIQLKAEKLSRHLEDIVLAQAIHHKPINNTRACIEKLK